MVIALNGSPKPNGNTAQGIGIIADELKKNSIDTEVIQIGSREFRGCTACGGCFDSGKCVFDDIHEIVAKMQAADGLIVGSPVYYAGINGTLKAFLDRAFYSGSSKLRWKPAAAFVVARRGGGTVSVHNIQQYFEIAEMVQVPTQYWSSVHGRAPSEIVKDEEGVDMLTAIGRNMAHLVKNLGGVAPPERVDRRMTNFVR